jgi:DNA gyrase inhibitor GyrI
MNEEVSIIRLEPMRVAALRGYGASPEAAAWEKARAWAASRGQLDELSAQTVFGFDNPPPAAEGGDYGYEIWVAVTPGFEPEGEVKVAEFGGGLYAVLACPVEGDPWRTIPAAWAKLHDWAQAHGYDTGSHQCFEKYRNPGAPLETLVLELYYPIAAGAS